MSALTTWLTAIADAIRGKDGTADPIDHIDFPDRITAIPLLDTTDATLTANDMLYGVTGYGADGTKLTGAGAYWQYVKQLYNTFSGSELAGDLVIYAPNATSIYGILTSTAITSLDITLGAVTTVRNAFVSCSALSSITFRATSITPSQSYGMFGWCSSLKTIAGTPLNFSGDGAATNCFAGCSALEEVRIVTSTMKLGMSFSASPSLSTESLLSIANGLDAAVAPKTLTMHATSITNMDNISVDVVDGVAVLGTAKTLTQFITTDKGWTIA